MDDSIYLFESERIRQLDQAASREQRLRNLAARCGQTFEDFKLDVKRARAANRALELAQWNS